MWRRYVAIGDSSTEGLDDPDGTGGFRGWADRLAQRIATAQGGLEYANLAVRGRMTRQIRDEQLPVALRLRPDLATVVAGMNDLMLTSYDRAVVTGDIRFMIRMFREQGAAVLTFTLPDPTPNMPFARRIGLRLAAFNEAMRQSAADLGAIMVDVAAYQHASDPRLWSVDRLHGNAAGHARVADALAHGLGLAGADETWLEPLPGRGGARGRTAAVAADLVWLRQHALPWMWRAMRGTSIGDGRVSKHGEPIELSPGELTV